MRSPKAPILWLLEKEWRELLASRAWWVLLVVLGPLVGLSFIKAVRTYDEISSLTGTAGGAGEVLAPLVGVWGPTFSACELAAVFLLPFVAIRLVSGDVQSGALKLELQQGMPATARIAAKAAVALLGWLIAMLPPLSAVLLWKSYGGTLYAPEMIALLAGHMLNAGLTVSLGVAAASLTENPSTAAILTLSATSGTWILAFFGAIQGGWLELAARYTPAAMVSQFQHGLVRLDTSVVAVGLILAGLAIAAIWMQLGKTVSRRVVESLVLGLVAAVIMWSGTRIPPAASWDFSESHSNSFAASDELALRSIHEALHIEARLAPEDPRRQEMEHRVLEKLRRTMPNVEIEYVSKSSTGIFEQSAPGYGEIHYSLGAKSAVSRSTTEEGVLEMIYSLAGVTPSLQTGDSIFRGHPLSVEPAGASAVFYGLWPGLFLSAGILIRKRLK